MVFNAYVLEVDHPEQTLIKILHPGFDQMCISTDIDKW